MQKLPMCAAACACALVSAFVCAGEPREPGFNELVIIEPEAQEDGLPAVSVEGGHVQIPPTLHVHPYYYCGDKEYQGPIINGGPTIIVANHPKSGEKLYIEAVLPAGAPLVAYSNDKITYIYKDRRVIVEFKRLFRHHAVVSYVSGRGIFRKTEEHVSNHMEGIRTLKRQSPLAAELGEIRRDTWRVAKGTVGAVSRVSATALQRVRGLTKVVPGVQALQSAADQAEERGAVEEIRQAGLQQAEDATKFIPTLR